MRAGALDRFVEVQTRVETQDATGQPILTWTRFARIWADVESIETPEIFTADRTVGTKLKNFTIRFLNGLTLKHRIVYNEENYDILSIAEVEKRGRTHFQKILAELKQ